MVTIDTGQYIVVPTVTQPPLPPKLLYPLLKN